MDKNKNLEEFFRNRVNDLDSGGDDWDRPDASVFRKAQEQFPTHPKKRNWDWKIIGIAILAAMALGLLTTVFYLNKKATTLEEQMHIAQTKAQTVDKKLTNLQNKYTNETTELSNQIAALSLQKEQIGNKNITETKLQHIADLNNTSKSSTSSSSFKPDGKKVIADSNISKKETTTKEKLLEWTNERLQTKSTASTIPSTTNKIQTSDKDKTSQPVIAQNNIAQSNTNKTTTNKHNKTLATSLPSLVFDAFKNTASKITALTTDEYIVKKIITAHFSKANRFELGLYATGLNFKTPTNYKFKEQKEIGRKNTNTYNQAFAPSLKIAYRISPNLWINTGFRKTNVNLKQNFSTALFYDKSREYTDGFGKRYNTLSFDETESGSDVASDLNFEIPELTEIDDKELYYVRWNHIRDFSWTQIPIGMSYFQGKANLQWFATGGIGLNSISGSQRFDDINFSYKEKDLPIRDRANPRKENEFKTQFISASAGFGLNYQITKHWQARSSFNLERNLIQKNRVIDLGGISQNLDVGIAYRW